MQTRNLKVIELVTLFSIGGATETVISIAEGLIKKGFNVEIATGPHIKSEGSMYEMTENLNIPVHTFNNLKRQINIFYDFLIIIQLALFIRNNKFSIVHTHSSKAGVVGRIAAFLAGTPVIVHTIHGLPFHRFQLPIINWLFITLEKISALFCQKVMCVSVTIMEILEKQKIVAKHKLCVVRSAFDNSEYFINEDARNRISRKYQILPDEILFAKSHVFLN